MELQYIFICFVMVLIGKVPDVSGAKILSLQGLASPSHYHWNRNLLIALAERGHDITVISCDTEDKPIPNITNIVLEGCYDFIRSKISFEGLSDDVTFKIRSLLEWSFEIGKYQLSTKGFKQLSSYPNGKIFDLIIAESEYNHCFWPFIAKFGYPPVVGVSGAGVPRMASDMFGVPKNPAYVPDYTSTYSDKMTFMQRMYSLYVDIHSYLTWNYEHLPKYQEVVDRHYEHPVPSLEDLGRNFSVVLTNTVFGYNPPQPLPPNVIPVGGLNLRPPRPLEPKLQKFLDDAKDGAIYFSLGTNVRSDMLPPHLQQAFLDVFASLPQRVLWKFESDLKNVPSNVLLAKWLPQRDILGHKNVKLFVTHHGLMGSQETNYFGVPTVGIPFFMDQHGNMERAVQLGTGVGLTYESLNKDVIRKSIEEVLTNKKYTENARRMSTFFRDQLEHPLDRAVFWTEYVLRHGGAPHLRSAAVDMPLYSYLLLDLLAAVVAVLVVAVLVLVTVTRYLWRHFASATQPRATSSKAKTS